MRHKLLLSIVAATVAAAPAAAQRCLGTTSFSAGAIRLGGGLSMNDGVQTWGVDVALGKVTGPFGGVEVARTSIRGSSWRRFVGVMGGYAVDMNPTRTLQFCPVVSLASRSGPMIGVGNFSGQSFSFGGSIGGVASSGPDFQFVPFGSVAYVNTRTVDAPRDVYVDYVGVEVGSGMVFNNSVTLKPSVAIPVTLDGGNATFRLAFSVNFGAAAR
jgi:hypothetical protein